MICSSLFFNFHLIGKLHVIIIIEVAIAVSIVVVAVVVILIIFYCCWRKLKNRNKLEATDETKPLLQKGVLLSCINCVRDFIIIL